MTLDEKRKVIEVLLCASDTKAPTCWMIAGEFGWHDEADICHVPPSQRTHGHSYTDGAALASPTYSSWLSMRARCNRPTASDYGRYGGRGITVCERWESFQDFIADMGERPAGTSIDRIDVNGNYEPANCRWATSVEQGRNRRNTKLEPHEPEQIRWLASLGYIRREIGAFFGISESLVTMVVQGRRWNAEAR